MSEENTEDNTTGIEGNPMMQVASDLMKNPEFAKGLADMASPMFQVQEGVLKAILEAMGNINTTQVQVLTALEKNQELLLALTEVKK